MPAHEFITHFTNKKAVIHLVYKWKVDSDVLKQRYLRRTRHEGLRHPKPGQISPHPRSLTDAVKG